MDSLPPLRGALHDDFVEQLAHFGLQTFQPGTHFGLRTLRPGPGVASEAGCEGTALGLGGLTSRSQPPARRVYDGGSSGGKYHDLTGV